jgi:uncharacterized metal-binding protein YceD (DUF177 family)
MEPRNTSRFSYHSADDDEPLEGGVHSTRPANTTTKGNHTTPGVPGPEERLLDISELVRNVGMQYTHRFRIPPQTEEDFEPVAPLEGQITLTNTGEILLLRGIAETTLRMDCTRCLNPTDQPVSTDLEEEFPLVAAHNAFRQEEVHAVDEDAGAPVVNGNILNLGELLRQMLIVAAPLQPLCKEDCTGDSSVLILAENAPVSVPEPVSDNPLKHLGELLKAREKE